MKDEILIIDDSRFDRIYLRTLIKPIISREIGDYYRIEEKDSAESAINYLIGNQAKRVALILCDRLMPGKDGFEMFEALFDEASEEAEEALKEIPKIVVTQSCEITDSHLQLLEAGVINGIFPKPIDRILPGSLEAILRLANESAISALNLVSLSILHDGKDELDFLNNIGDSYIRKVVLDYRRIAREAIGLKRW